MTQETEIPEDVLKAAMLHLRGMEQDVEERGDGQWKVKGFGVRNAIARGIMAERERLFDALMGQYEGWTTGPGADGIGALALSAAIFNLFPEHSKRLIGPPPSVPGANP